MNHKLFTGKHPLLHKTHGELIFRFNVNCEQYIVNGIQIMNHDPPIIPIHLLVNIVQITSR